MIEHINSRYFLLISCLYRRPPEETYGQLRQLVDINNHTTAKDRGIEWGGGYRIGGGSGELGSLG